MSQSFQHVSLDRLLTELDRSARQLVGATAKAVGKVGLDQRLSLSQYRALVLAAHEPGLSIRDVASCLDIAPSSATRLCRRLIDRGFMAAEQSTEDRRLIALSLTGEGNRIIRSVAEARRKILAEAVKDAGVEASDDLEDALRRLNEALENLDREVIA